MAPLADALLSVIPKAWHLPEHLVSYHAGVTPLSTPPVVVACLIGYLTTIFSLREVMRSREPMKLTTPFQIHNIYLTAGSGLLLLLMIEEIAPIWWKGGLFNAMCAESSWTPRLEFYYMINYYIKYVELADTVFLVLKKKPLAFLHVFHHAATALLCFTQLNGRTSVSWVPIVLNLTVHVFMYYYYWATAGGRKIWASRAPLVQPTRTNMTYSGRNTSPPCKSPNSSLTSSRSTLPVSTQPYTTLWRCAISGLALHVPAIGYSYFSTTYWPFLPTMGTCSGTEGAALFGCGLLTSYLFLFIDFYIRTYKKAPVKGKAKSS
ncbi:unnamed protein product [Rhizoctonia solani]|uniref:Elongation of fatty acids protein n=1 Tax=Rhizoctonia solani TaxID=456999 RepID=A0A8H3E0Z3_9AGAM|nr:unnamed protein product [Rhizoctonia solani]